ncbi:MAG: metal-sensing transcriptional repressor [Patescibacteria group bacterium]
MSKPKTQSSKTREQISRRLAIAEGQMRALRRMIEEEKYCIDILTQAEALKKAISGAEELVLENHVNTHVVEMVRLGKSTRAAKEITNFYKLIR